MLRQQLSPRQPVSCLGALSAPCCTHPVCNWMRPAFMSSSILSLHLPSSKNCENSNKLVPKQHRGKACRSCHHRMHCSSSAPLPPRNLRAHSGAVVLTALPTHTPTHAHTHTNMPPPPHQPPTHPHPPPQNTHTLTPPLHPPPHTPTQVKEAFRKLVWQYHPDKAAPDARLAAEAKFKEVRWGGVRCHYGLELRVSKVFGTLAEV